MLQITDSAIDELEDARGDQDVPDDYGLRVFGQPTENGQVALSLAFAEEPADGDEVTEQSGTQIYVAADVAEPLSDSTIDLEETEQGMQLVVKPQEDAE